MTTHSSILAWRIPGTEEPRGLPSMGSHRVGHDWSDLAAAAAPVNGPIILPTPYCYGLSSLYDSHYHHALGFSGGSVVKSPPAMQDTACNAGDMGAIPRSGRSPGEGLNLETKPPPPPPPPPLSCSLPVWGKMNITHLLSQKNALNLLLSHAVFNRWNYRSQQNPVPVKRRNWSR